ncbi:MAG: serine hydrolase [Thermoplasmatales archaeon]|nr:MAG: serine hydrolase [Thermoplasmatales archaeon]
MIKIKIKKIFLSIILSLFICSSFISVSGIFVTDNLDKINLENEKTTGIKEIIFDMKMKFLIKLTRFPSISACIINEDEVTWSKGYGIYDLDNGKPATENTIYNVGSITKTITGTAFMQLWEKGLFDLDEDVNNYLPFSLRNPNFPDIPITFRMLLSHSSSLNYESGIDGVKYYGWLNFSQDPPFKGYPDPFLKEHLTPGGKWYYPERWSNDIAPGELSVYSNVNFDLIAYLVEIISNEPFLDYCNNNIFQPLEMYNTSFNLSELDIDSVAIPYHYHDSKYIQINELSYILGDYTPPEKYWRVHMYPVGGLYTTVSDISHFLIAHMNGGVYNGVRILEENTIKEMHNIQPPGNIEAGLQYYGLAWIIFKDPFIFNTTISGFSGDTYGVSTWMVYNPSEDIGVIYFSNGDRQNEKNPLLGKFSMILFLQVLFKKGGYNLLHNLNFGRNQ